ncbi:MAG: hypothetical protein ACPGU1_11725 [Myxococcota bacterium]
MRKPYWLLCIGLVFTMVACGDDASTDVTGNDDDSLSASDANDDNTDDPGDGNTDDPGDGNTDDPGDGNTDDPGDGNTEADFELTGEWDDNYGGTTSVDSESWGFDIVVSYDNDANWAIVQVPEDAAWNPGTYSKVVWTEPVGGRFFLCTVDFALETQEAAEASEATADDSAPLEGGCGDFAWTELRTPLEVKGEWHTNWDENIMVTTFMWGASDALVAHNNDDNWAVSQVSEDAEWNPGTYSKHVWTEIDAEGSFWMCTVAYGFETWDEAAADTTEVDDSNPAEGGCGDFAWSRYIPIVELTGTWHSQYGGEARIDSALWEINVVHAYDNDANWAVVQLPESDEWNPSAFQKNVWTEPEADGSFYLCSVAYGLETLEQALAAEDTSDASDPATSGCGDFNWTHYGPILEIGGDYMNQFDSEEQIDSDTWNSYDVVSYDNAMNHAVLYTPEDAESNPDTYSKVIWLDASWDGSFYYCTVGYDFATADEAAAAEDTSDASDPDVSGCGGFSWTKLTPTM